MEKRNRENIISSIRMTLSRDQIMSFVGGLHDLQFEMIETLVARKEREGFPEVQEVLQAVKRRL